MWIKIIKEAVAVMLIALFLAGAGYALRPGLMLSKPDDQANVGTSENDLGFTEITLEDARSHFEQNTALFADARPMKAYSTGHIKGAMNLDPNEFDTWSGDFFSRVSPDQIIVTYCEGAQCELSMQLAEKLIWMGYEKVFYLKNGWGLWKESQLPREPETK